VVSISTVSIQSRVDGTLDKVHFREGDRVRQDDLIYTIDPRPFQAALNQARANLEKDLALQRNAETEARRNRELLQSNILSREVYEQSESAAEALQATAVADRAAIENAELQVSYCFIRSPVNGRTGPLQVTAGNVVKSQTTVLVTINQTEPIYVDFSVPEQKLPEVREHMNHGTLKVDATPPGAGARASGELALVGNNVDTNTGTILLRAQFANEGEVLWPGQYVNAALTLTTLSNAIAVPAQCVQTGQDGQYIFVVRSDGTVDTKPVQVTMRQGEWTVLSGGATAGDEVVTTGQVRLGPGTKVEVTNRGQLEQAPVNGQQKHELAGASG